MSIKYLPKFFKYSYNRNPLIYCSVKHYLTLSSFNSNNQICLLPKTNILNNEIDYINTIKIIKRELNIHTERILRKMYWRKKSFDAIPEKLRPRSDWQDWDYSSEIFAFARRLNECELDEKILTQMFTHRSYVNVQNAKREALGVQEAQFKQADNVEMINDGLLLMEEFLPKYLRYHLKMAPEECIQSIVKYLLSKPILSDISKWIGCIDLILCEEFPPNENTLADTVLALIGAIKQTSGQKRAQNFIIDFVLTYINGIDPLEIWRLDELNVNLNRFLHLKGMPPAEPRIMYKSATGTIESCYIVGIYVDKKLLGKSAGESPNIAKRMAELDVFRNQFGLNIKDIQLSFGPKAYDLHYEEFNKENFRIL